MEPNDETRAAGRRAATHGRRRVRLRRLLRSLLRLRGSPSAIAGGAAIGVVIAFTPTIGFQMLLALGCATLAGANRPAALAPTWLTNPVTIAPVYAFTFYLGSFFWQGPEHAAAARALFAATDQLETLDPLALGAQLRVLLDLGTDAFVAMWIGGLMVGLPLAAITYVVVSRTVTELREQHARRRSQRTRAGGSGGLSEPDAPTGTTGPTGSTGSTAASRRPRS